ncbi:MAG: TIM barrel protein [Bacillota bacterium]|nr:TIM barrel protein [Bacillota bacterium]
MKQKIGLQLFSLREVIGDDVDGALRQVAAAGYNCVEFAGYYGMEAGELAALCRSHGLEPYSTHVRFDMLKDHLDEVVDYSRRLGLSYVICPGAPHSTPEEVAELASVLNQAREALAPYGIRTGYHNHSSEFETFADGRYIYDHLIAAYAAEDMVAEVDTCWVAVGGVDPVAYVDGLGATAGPLHFKELSATWQPGSRDVDEVIGRGVIDFKSLLEVMQKNGTLERGVIVEQEGFRGDPYEELAEAAARIRALWPEE